MEKLHISMIIEVLGKPKEHLENALSELIEQLSKEKNLKLLNKNFHEAKPIEKSDLFTTFADVEAEIETIEDYVRIVFTYLPSHIEIISPEKISLSNFDVSDLGTKIMQRIHEYDALTKKMLTERELIFNRFRQDAPDSFNKLVEELKARNKLPEKSEKPSKSNKTKKKE